MKTNPIIVKILGDNNFVDLKMKESDGFSFKAIRDFIKSRKFGAKSEEISKQPSSGVQEKENFLHTIVSCLETQFALPEEFVFKQDQEDSTSMYFIARGDCLVNIREHDRKEKIAVRVLCEGHHFGEISLIYNCPRTASIQSRNYNTLAGLRKDMFRVIHQEFPEFKQRLIRHLFKYNYRKKEFLKQAF